MKGKCDIYIYYPKKAHCMRHNTNLPARAKLLKIADAIWLAPGVHESPANTCTIRC
jgi:hypothetical protein